jgi:AcrR family transcriptional regulator
MGLLFALKENNLTDMEKHQGQIVEYIVRKNGFSLSELAKALNINRRSLYNWFQAKELKKSIIHRIGCVLRHDFSKEFPELFLSEDFNSIYEPKKYRSEPASVTINDDDIWKHKYITLLEQYSQLLSINNARESA